MSTNDGELVLERRNTISLMELFAAYLRMGFTAFGPAMMAETKKHIVKKKKWISEEEFLNGLALGQLLTGATFVSLTVYIGYRLRGVSGAVVSFLGFLLPPFMVMTLLSYLYFAFGELSLVKILFKGVVAIVVALITNAVWEVGKSAVTDYKGGIIALLALGVMVVYPNIFVVLGMAAIAGLLLFYQGAKKVAENKSLSANNGLMNKSKTLKEAVILFLALVTLIWVAALQPVLLQLGGVFFRMGALVFGNGFTMIPLIQQEVVSHYHWLTMNEFAVGLALGQITPGPVLITATFVGYKVAGIKGAVAGTLGIFLPSLLLVMFTAEVHQKIKNNPLVKAAIKGMVASFVGMMLVVIVGLARHSLVDMPTLILAILALLAFRLTKLDALWVITGGAALYLAMSQWL
ncbi:MAG: chromate efflux transporter [Desulfosporosinus sp.]|nr:chromate efflux transporter [Desulfosporosinus sp.]